MAIYKLPLDDELDKDIIDWIASFPRNRKSEVVRQAIRNTINGTFETSVVAPKVKKEEVLEPAVEHSQLLGDNRFAKFAESEKVIKPSPKSLDGLF